MMQESFRTCWCFIGGTTGKERSLEEKQERLNRCEQYIRLYSSRLSCFGQVQVEVDIYLALVRYSTCSFSRRSQSREEDAYVGREL